MFRMAFIIGIVHTFCRLAVNADRSAGMIKGTDIGIATSLGKALATGAVTVAGVTASHHDITLAAAILLIITTV